jgi:serine/threonine protein kinase
VELSVYLRKYQCLEEKEARSIIRQLFSAIYYMYRLKERVIHYDLKPSNIMYCDGIVKILDFGLCKVMTNSE